MLLCPGESAGAGWLCRCEIMKVAELLNLVTLRSPCLVPGACQGPNYTIRYKLGLGEVEGGGGAI